MSIKTETTLYLNNTPSEVTVYPCGSWRLAMLEAVSKINPIKLEDTTREIIVDGSNLIDLDTGGAKILLDKINFKPEHHVEIKLNNFDPDAQVILELVKDRLQSAKPVSTLKTISVSDKILKLFKDLIQSIKLQISFLGQLFLFFIKIIISPSVLRRKELFVQLETAGLKAVPILCLVNYLIGLVVAYLFASQAEKFGANIFIVDAVGMGMCRELSPMLVAIIIAGRSGSAYTAQIGTMKINEEIDAIRVIGLSAFEVLVIPRVLALVLFMPLLVFIGDIFGILGGVTIADTYLGITPSTFFNRLQQVLSPRHVWIGLSKAPIFAIVISMIACRQGLSVENNARSVGINTTATVVQSIVAVILLDAAFAVLFQQLKW